MPGGRRGLVAPQNTFLENIIRRCSSQRKYKSQFSTYIHIYFCRFIEIVNLMEKVKMLKVEAYIVSRITILELTDCYRIPFSFRIATFLSLAIFWLLFKLHFHYRILPQTCLLMSTM